MKASPEAQPSLFDVSEPVAVAERPRVYKSVKFRLYPNASQKMALDQQLGCCRFVYNWALDYRTWMYREHGIHVFNKDCSALLPDLKRYLPWLMTDSNAHALQQSLAHLDGAFRRFFQKKGGYPRFKSSKINQSMSVLQRFRLDMSRGLTSISKIRDIPTNISCKIKGEIQSLTVTRTPSGKYFVWVHYIGDEPMLTPTVPSPADALGIDLGLTHFATFSTGEKIENPRFYEKAEKRLRRLNKSLARKQRGSANRAKAKQVLALHHERTVNCRADFLHKLTSRLTRENQAGTICVEALNVAGMVKNRRLSKAIGSASWGEFVRQLEYKAAWYGKNLLKCGRFEASSKTCSECGIKNESLTLNVRKWTCACCGARHDRDVNAARNIIAMAFRATYPEDTGDLKPVERKALAVARATVKPSSEKQESRQVRLRECQG